MKKSILLSLMLALILSFQLICVQAADAGIFTEFENGLSNWETYAENGDVVETKDTADIPALALEGKNSTGSLLRARCETLPFTAGEQVAVSFRFSLNLDDVADAEYALRLCWGNEGINSGMGKNTNLIKVTNDGLVLGDDQGSGTEIPFGNGINRFQGNEEHYITAMVDFSAKTIKVWLDGSCIEDNGNQLFEIYLARTFTPATTQFYFENKYASVSNPAVAGYYVYDFMATNKNAMQIVSEPADQSELVNTEDYKEIKVKFGTVAGGTVRPLLEVADLGSDSFTAVNNVEVINYGSTLKVRPNDGLLSFKTYRLTLSNMTTLFGTPVQDVSISFGTAAQGYIPPSVKITAPAPGTIIRLGKAVELSVEVEGSQEIQKVTYFAGNQQIGESDIGPYSINWTPQSQGQISLTAQVTDVLGGSAKSAPINVTVQENKLPVVSMDISSGIQDIANLKKVTVTAEDTDGTITAVEVYKDGVKAHSIDAAPYTFDASDIGLGTHTIMVKAIDNEEGSTVKIAEMTVIKTGETINYTENFDKYLSEGQNEAELEISGGSALTVNGNIAATTNGGYVRVRQVSADHGASGITGTEDGMTVTGGGPYLGFITNEATATLRVKCEIYFSSLDINGEVNTRGVNSSGAASHMKHFEIVKDQMKVYNGTTVANTIQLTAGEWHTFEYVPDFTNKTYDFYWDGEKIASNYAFRDPDFKQVMNNIRIHMNHAGHTEGFTAIDNMQLSTIIKYPYVTEISNVGTASGSANLVDYNTEQFKVQMTGEFESVDVSQVSLFAEGKEVAVKNVKKDAADPKNLIITTDGNLKSSSDYKLVLKSTLQTAGTRNPMESDTTAYFKTTAKPFDVLNASFAAKNGRLSFTAEINNDTQEEKSVTVMMVVYDNGKIVDIKAVSRYLGAVDSTVIAIPEIQLPGENASAKAFVFDGWAGKKPVNDKVYLYN